MNQIRKTASWLKHGEFLSNGKVTVLLWFGLSFLAILGEVLRSPLNNYLIFKHVFIHACNSQNLYLPYPKEYNDVNLYGPFFSVVIAPFSVFPNWIGAFLWEMCNVTFLYYAIRQLPLNKGLQNTILILSSVEMMNTASWLQSNALICGCIILSFTNIRNKKEIWAAFFVLFATFIKLYGIVGFAFIFFANKKWKFLFGCILWSAIFFVTPMLLAKPHFIIQSYVDWKQALITKDAKNVNLNINNDFQDISVHGLFSRLLGIKTISNSILLIIALIVFAFQYIKIKFFSDIRYQLYILGSTLLFLVLFSTSSESPTYIISFLGICIWYVLQPSAKWINAVFIFALIVTSFSYSDLLTPWFREHVALPYAIKALPSLMVWIIILYQIFTEKFIKVSPNIFVSATIKTLFKH